MKYDECSQICSMQELDNHYLIVEKVIKFIRANQTEQPSLDEISQHVFLSKFHLQRVFQEWAGVSPKQFLQYLTVEHSKALLRLGKNTLETSYEVGLSGNGRLHDLFLKCEAMTPGEFKSQGQNLQIDWEFISTAFGNVLIAETNRGICKISFTDNPETTFQELTNEFPHATCANSLGKNGLILKKYFEDWKIPKDKINLHLKGTPFQLQVWKALLQIPTSQLASYQDIGHKIGNPKAVRAIGTAIGKNPIAYLIPCHRVIKNNGLMGNYRWQAERKIIINAFEAAQF